MVTGRHKAVTQIMECMTNAGYTFVGKERDTVRALKKLWLIMDLPRNGVRIGAIHNENYWTDQDIFMATFFLIKLDMRFTDPVEGTGETGLRKLMMGQRSLFPLRDLLMGKLTKFDLLKMYVCYDFTPRPELQHLPCLGIPPHLIGRGCTESWGLGTLRLLRPDELLVREQIRRCMNLHMRYLEMIRFGYKMQDNDLNTRKSEKVTIGESTNDLEWLLKRYKEVLWEKKERELRAWAKKEERMKAELAGKEVAKTERTSVWLLGKKKFAIANQPL